IRVNAENTVKANLDDMVFEPLTQVEKNAVQNFSIGTSVEIKVDTYIERKQSFARVSFVPLRKNPTSGQLGKLVSFKLQTQPIPLGSAKTAGTKIFAQSSVLRNGDWYKVAVSQDGIHRIIYNELESMG